MPTYKRHKMCAECPFRANSPEGWLGPHTVQEMEQIIQSDEPFICHLDINQRSKYQEEDEILEEGQHCVGILRYQSSLLKRSRDPEKSNAQVALKEFKDQPVIPARQFSQHHGG